MCCLILFIFTLLCRNSMPFFVVYLNIFTWQVTVFKSPIVTQHHNNKCDQRHWLYDPCLSFSKLPCSQSMPARWNLHPFLILFTYELMIPLWAHCGHPNTLLGATVGDVCMILVGKWNWWLTQCETWFHSLIAAPSWIGHKPTETYWPWWKNEKKKRAPCLYMTHFVGEKSLLDVKQLWKAIVNLPRYHMGRDVRGAACVVQWERH